MRGCIADARQCENKIKFRDFQYKYCFNERFKSGIYSIATMRLPLRRFFVGQSH